MSRLREVQQAFSEGVIEGKHRAVVEAMAPGGSALRSVALYRRLIRYNYTQVLKVTYPVLHRFVGERYFGIVARGYFKSHPSTSGDLFFYGRHLPPFLRAVSAPPLLVEMARLEWACHEVHQAADAPPVSLEQWQAVASVSPSRVTVHRHPASRLLSFPFPVHRVWLVLQPEAPADTVVELPLPEEETGVMVTRGFGKVQITPLARLDYLVLEALSRGVDVATVERMAIESKPEFDFQRFLATVLNLPMISGLSVKEAP
jgi:hypothetical protein